MRPEGEHTKEAQTMRRRAADCPDWLSLSHQIKRRVWLRYVLQRFQFLQFFKDHVPGCWKNRAFLDNHFFYIAVNEPHVRGYFSAGVRLFCRAGVAECPLYAFLFFLSQQAEQLEYCCEPGTATE